MNNQKSNLIYLASPYANPNPEIMEERYRAMVRVVYIMYNKNIPVYSPIVHNHPVALLGLPRDWAFWETIDLEILAFCKELWVIQLPGWQNSFRIRQEVAFAKENKILVSYVEEVLKSDDFIIQRQDICLPT